MNRLTIVMNNDRSLIQDTYSLGVERDNKIDELALITPKTWSGLDMFSSVVSLHLKAENDYFYNAVCDNKHIDGDFAVFLFPVTREMTNRNGKVRLEFAFENSAFCFTSRSIELMVNKALTDSETVESDYPGVLVDVLNSVDGFSKKLDSTDELLKTIDNDVAVLIDKADRFDDSIGKIEAFLGYDDEEILGLEADFENNTFSRLAGARGLSAGADFDNFSMYQRRRCNVSDDGTIAAFYGDQGYRDDGTNGQVMVYQPAFYYRVVPTKLEKQESGLGYHIRKANYYISEKPKPFFKLHPAFYDVNGNPVEYILYSAYEGAIYDVSGDIYIKTSSNTAEDLLCSVAGVIPSAVTSRANFETLSQNRGENWHIETIKAFSATQLLMIIEYGNFNMQSHIGKGAVALYTSTTENRNIVTGSTASLGNNTGIAESSCQIISGVETVYTEDGTVSMSYRGQENVWGNTANNIGGINIWGDGTMGGGQAYIAENFVFSDSVHDGNYAPVGFTCTASKGYVGAFGYGNEKYDWLFLPSDTTGSSALPVGDYAYVETATKHLNVLVGGSLGFNDAAGPFWVRSMSEWWQHHISNRLMYVPTAK